MFMSNYSYTDVSPRDMSQAIYFMKMTCHTTVENKTVTRQDGFGHSACATMAFLSNTYFLSDSI